MNRYNVLALLAALVLTQSAQGFFIMDERSATFVGSQVCAIDWNPIVRGNREALVEVGSGKAARKMGRGERITLKQALQMILPRDWTVFGLKKGRSSKKGVSGKRLVSWYGGSKPWTEVLRRMATTHGYRMTVDWYRRYVFVEPARLTPAVKTGRVAIPNIN